MKLRALCALLAAAVAVAGCGSDGDGPVGPSAGPPTEVAETTTTEARLPAPPPYQSLPGEPAADAKKLAADLLQAIGTYEEGAGTVSGAEARLAGIADPALAQVASPLLAPDAQAAVEIVYPQLGGLTDTQASIMVVARQRLLRDGAESSVTRTIDVRLARSAAGWAATSIESLGGEPPASPAPSALGQAVLGHDAIDLPDSARWDIEAGMVDDRVLQVLLDLAAEHQLGVVTLASGHPYNVFASQSVSNHTRGRAVDIWSIDGQAVLLQRDPAGPLHALVTRLLAGSGLTEVGSPWDLDPVGGPSFTDTVHQDHLHLGFKR